MGVFVIVHDKTSKETPLFNRGEELGRDGH